MKKNVLAKAIGLTSAAMALGIASGQAAAVEFEAGDVMLDVYGYAQLNAVYDIDQDIGLDTQAGHFPYLFDNDDGRDGHFDADAQQSRLGVTATHASGVSVTVEGDFRGGDFRLLRAYGEYGNWMAGRNWSNYTSFVGWTPTLDFDGLAGLAGIQDRAAQVRYSNGPWSFSVEDPNFQRIADTDDEKQSAPVVTARYEDALTSNVMFSAGALLQYLSYDEGDAGDDDNAVGMAGYVAADISLTDALTLHGVLNASDGANGYLYRSGDSGFGGNDAYLDGSSLETISGYGGTIGASADVGAGTLNAGYGLVEMDWDDYESDVGAAAADARVETNSNAFVNYQWNPIEHVMLGVEYGYFKSELYSGDSEDAQRVMFASRYSF
ncbi:hypothetical protein ACJO2E_10290 [Marinobacter sp. M1N3S26]|uniref:hypothetical protein n=1 Tax=Marinobacter sp. LN3S78 TaxID=3382300 RepID=UPI00387AB57B